MAQSLSYASQFLQAATGLDVEVSRERGVEADHRVFLVIRDAAMPDAAAEAGASEAIGQDFPVSEVFLMGREQRLGRVGEPDLDKAGLKADAISCIVADLPPEDLAACIKSEVLSAAELVNSPLGTASAWDDDWERWEPQSLAGESYSVRDWALLRLLHHPDVPPGTPRGEVLARLRAWHDARCRSGD